MATHRYWRMYVTKTCSPASVYLSISTLEMRTSVGGAQAATGGTASASNTLSTNTADKAFDANTSTLWHTDGAAGPWWIKYDLGAGNEKDFVEFAIQCQASFADRAPSSFLFQYSDDNTNWTTLYTLVDEDIYGDSELRVFGASDSPTKNGNKTFWRVNATANSAGNQSFLLKEMEMATSIGGTDVCTGGKAYRYPAGAKPQATYRASNAFDDNSATLSSNQSLTDGWPQYVGYRFSSSQEIVELKMQSSSASQAPTAFTIEYWDGSAYQVAATYSGLSWAASEVKTFTFGAATARPVVFVCT
jgi:hypothetical protein